MTSINNRSINQYEAATALLDVLYLELSHVNFLLQDRHFEANEQESKMIKEKDAYYFNHIDPFFTAYSTENWDSLSNLNPREPHGQYLAYPVSIFLKKRGLLSILLGVTIGTLMFQGVSLLLTLYALVVIMILMLAIRYGYRSLHSSV